MDVQSSLVDKRRIENCSQSKASTLDEAIALVKNSNSTRKHVVYAIGTNDIKVSDISVVKDKIETLVEKTKQIHKGVFVHFCTIFPIHNQQAQVINSHIQEIAKGDNRVRYVNTSNINTRDRIHPTNDGSREMENLISKSVYQSENMFRKRSSPA